MCDLLRSFNKIKSKKSDSYITIITSTICPNNSINFTNNFMAIIRSHSVCGKIERCNVQNGFEVILRSCFSEVMLIFVVNGNVACEQGLRQQCHHCLSNQIVPNCITSHGAK